MLSQQIHDEPDQEILARGGAFGNKQGERRQRCRIQGMRDAFLLQIQYEQKGADALIAIGKRVILDDKIQDVRRLFLARPLERLAEHGLLDAGENPFQPLATGMAEERRGLIAGHQCASEIGNGATDLGGIQHTPGGPHAVWRYQPVFVILQQ